MHHFFVAPLHSSENQVKFLPESMPSAVLTRDRLTALFTDTLVTKAGVERGWRGEGPEQKRKWIYQVALHLKISLCFQGHNAGQGGEDEMKRTFLTSLHLESSSQENTY